MNLSFLAKLLLLQLSVATFVLTASFLSPFMPDDAYISFQYAQNLAHGHGLTFNAGEDAVEGYSNLLWILIVSIAVNLGLDVPSLSPLLGVVAAVLTIFVFWLLLQRRKLSALQQFVPMLVVSCSAPLALYAVSGMETALYSLLLLVGILCLDYSLSSYRRAWLVGLATTSFLLALTRPEGAIFFPIAIAALVFKCLFSPSCYGSVYQRLKWLLIASALFLFLFGGYQFWRVLYFSEFVPTPFLSKGVGERHLLSTLMVNLEFYFLVQNHYFAPFGYYFLVIAALPFFGIVAGFLDNRRFPFFESTVFLIASAHVVVYASFVDWMPAMRYHAPLVFPYLLASAGIFRLISFQGKGVRSPLFIGYVGAIAFALCFSAWGVAMAKRDAVSYELSMQESLVPLSEWLRESVPEGTLLAISDVGVAAYSSRLPVFDSNPKSLTDRHIAQNGWSNEYFFARDPGVAVFVSFSLEEPKLYAQHADLLEDRRFHMRYRLVGITRADWFLDRSYWIYARNTLALTKEQIAKVPRGVGR
jgi:arabinofuranosyltransferase